MVDPRPPRYAELHCLSNFTFLRGASHPEELVARAAGLGYTALAITDECSLAGVVRAHIATKKHAIRLIVGTEVRLVDGLRLVLLATDREGYGNLSELITRGRRAAEKGSYRLVRADLEHGLGGCLALLLPPPGGIGDCLPGPGLPAVPSSSPSSALTPPCRDAEWIGERFPGRAWIAVELLHGPDDRAHLQACVQLGRAVGLPLVAAGDVHMHVRSRRVLQDVLTAVRCGCTLAAGGFELHPNGERHLRRRERLARIYPRELLAESVHIAGRCDFSLDTLRYEYPEELVPPGESAAGYLRRLTERGMCSRWPEGAPRPVKEQVDRELRLIADLAYEPYFLTVHDMVRFARERGILCQGRGSAANSAVCYCLGITEVDPARMSMLFERFISRERNEPPDIDVDFEHERREEVIQYIYAKYGRDRAAIAATVITYHPKSAVRDAGKALGLTLEQVDRLAKSLVWWDGQRVCPERLREIGFDPASPVLSRLLRVVNALVGFPRHLSQHVGGFVIARDRLSRLVPIENAAMPERSVIEWDKDDLDALGLLKVDVLALGMLSAIRRAFDLIAGYRVLSSPLSMADIPPEDPAVYEMIRRADTVGVFQIESRAQMAMLPRLGPRSFYDLVIEVAIVRPGPIQGGMVHPYLRRRQGLEPVSYPSAAVQTVLARTLGVPIFQEQVMQLAVVAAGFSPGEADQLRRAMAAWRRRGDLRAFEERLHAGMRERGYPSEFAGQIFRQIQGFGEYGFPESHAASFALLVYVSAWLKHHEPAAFTCALLNSQPMGFYAPAQLVQDARRHEVVVRPVAVNRSHWDCTLEASGEASGEPPGEPPGGPPGKPLGELHGEPPVKSVDERPGRATRGSSTASCGARPGQSRGDLQPALRLGLRMVRGFPRAAAQRLLEARAREPFRDALDLARRARLGRREMELLAGAGALAEFAGDRHQARWQVLGIEPMPPLLQETEFAEPVPPLPRSTEGEELVADYAAIGLSLGRHPLALLRGHLARKGLLQAAEVQALGRGEPVRTGGLVVNRQAPATASGVIFATLEDETGFVNLVVWPWVAQRQRRILLAARLLGVRGVIEREGEVVHVVAARLEDHTRLLGRLPTRSRDFQ